jgi:hypothetical protein
LPSPGNATTLVGGEAALLPDWLAITAAAPEGTAIAAAIPKDNALCATIHVLTNMDVPLPWG